MDYSNLVIATLAVAITLLLTHCDLIGLMPPCGDVLAKQSEPPPCVGYNIDGICDKYTASGYQQYKVLLERSFILSLPQPGRQRFISQKGARVCFFSFVSSAEDTSALARFSLLFSYNWKKKVKVSRPAFIVCHQCWLKYQLRDFKPKVTSHRAAPLLPPQTHS